MNTLKHLLISIVILITFGCSSSCAKVNTQKIKNNTNAFIQVFHTTKIISCKEKFKKDCPIGEYTQTGSGIKINLVKSENLVLSAGHVCDTQPSEKISKSIQAIVVRDTYNQVHQAWPVHVTFNDNNKKTADLCLLWVPTLTDTKSATVSKSAPDIGDEIYYIGAPMGIFHPPTVPIFRGMYSGKLDNSSSIITAAATGGSSGGPVFNSRHQIIGVVFAANRDFHHVTLMTDYKILQKFLSDGKNKFNKLNVSQ